MAVICVFGDSTAWGAWDKEKGGWVNRLWFYSAGQESYNEIYNLSISGGTTETILARFETESKIREADILLFQTGGNDAARAGGRDGNHQISSDKFKLNLEEIILRAKKITDKIIFIDLKNCDESKTAPVPWRDIYYLNNDLGEYNKIMQDVCEANSVLCIDTFGLLENSDFEDGIHPNASGHQKIFEKVRDSMLQMKLL